jgi:hypothetical protein
VEVGSEPGEAVMAGQRAVALERGEHVEPGLRAVDHPDGHAAVERDDRAGRYPFQEVIQSKDLPPVGVVAVPGLGVHRRDRRLQLVRAERAGGEGAGHQAAGSCHPGRRSRARILDIAGPGDLGRSPGP